MRSRDLVLAGQLPRGSSDWLIEVPRAAYSTQLRGYLNGYAEIIKENGRISYK